MEEINKPHVVAIPFAAQGHVMPLMKFSHRLVDQGIKVTFVNTEKIHTRLVNAVAEKRNEFSGMNMVTIPDGLKPEDHESTLLIAPPQLMLTSFEKLIENILEKEKITCVIADETAGWAIEIVKKIGVRCLAFFPGPAGAKALMDHIPKLIEMGVIEENGTIIKKDATIQLSPTLPPVKAKDLTWWCNGETMFQQMCFQINYKHHKIAQSTDLVICNTWDQLEQPALSSVAKLHPIGPLIENNPLGNFWPEDSTCINWLDQQPTNSVIYIAFGSIASFTPCQFHELALGLELLGRPFLWVMSEKFVSASGTTFPDGFKDRVANIGKIVDWAPQQKVLSHPSTACFLSHCGWNSTIDGVSMGVPIITWPFFADQFLDASFITDVWKIGLGLNKDEDGIVPKDEIKRKVDQLLDDKEIKANALKLKETAMISIGKDGPSTKNFEQLIEDLKR